MAKVKKVPLRTNGQEKDLGWFCQLDFLTEVSDWLDEVGIIVGIADIDDVIEALHALGYVQADVDFAPTQNES